MSSIGFDGASYVIESVRDLDGNGKRHIYRRVHYDVIERLARSRQPLIDQWQRNAAVRLQVDDQLAKTATLARSGGGSGGAIDFALHVGITDARARVRAAQAMLARDWPVTSAVVLGNSTLGEVERQLELRKGRALTRLRSGLDRLGDFYGLLGRLQERDAMVLQ